MDIKFVWDAEKFLETDSGHSCTTLLCAQFATELNTLKWLKEYTLYQVHF